MLSNEIIQNQSLQRPNSKSTLGAPFVVPTHDSFSASWLNNENSPEFNSRLLNSALKSAGTTRSKKSITILRPESMKRANNDACMAAAIGDLEWLKQSLTISSHLAFDKNGLATIHLASIHGRMNIIKYLIEELYVDPNFASTHGWRPVHLCISNQIGAKAVECLSYLIEKGAEVNVSNDDGLYPLHMAATEGHSECAKILLTYKADPFVEDHRGQKPIDLAKLWGHKKCAKILLAAMWHDDKTAKFKDETLQKRLKTQEVLQEIEKAHTILYQDKEEGEQKFDIWLHNQTFLKKESDSKRTSAKTREPIIINHFSDRTPKKLLPAITKSANNVSNDESHIHDIKKLVITPRNYVIMENPNDWNFSTKVTEKEYVKNLDDFYPRDPFTLLPSDKDMLLLHRQLHGMTIDEVKEFMQKDLKDHEKKQNTEKKVRIEDKKKLKSKSFKDERPVYYKPNTVLNVEPKRKAKNENVDEAGLILASDPKSFSFKRSNSYVSIRSTVSVSSDKQRLRSKTKNEIDEIKSIIQDPELYDFMKDKNGKINQKYEKVYIC